MNTLFALTYRHSKLFFKDKGMIFASLMTPIIILLLYVCFLGTVYKQSLLPIIPEGIVLSDKLINGYTGGQLISSLLAVSCITVSFCCNLTMVQDKFNESIKDFTVSPVKKTTLAASYVISTFISTLIICLIAMGLGLVYIAFIGWYLSFVDVLLIIVDVVLLTLFGTIFSSIICTFLTTQGQMSAAGTIVSAGYGFICGAYMPLAQFSEVLRNILMFLPGTYGTSLVRNHSLNGVLDEMAETLPSEVIEGISDAFDVNLYFFGGKVEVYQSYLVIIGSIIALFAIYLGLNYWRSKKIKTK